MKNKYIIIIMTLVMLASLYILMYGILPKKGKEYDNYVENGQGREEETYDNSKEREENLSKSIIVIDSGHGGIDPGKIGVLKSKEKDINLSIAYKLKELLERENFNIIMTRTADEGLYDEKDSNKKSSDLRKRCDIINNSGAKLAVSIHQNSYKTPEAKGAQVFYYRNSTEGRMIARFIQASFRENLDADNNRVEKADASYYMLLNTTIPVVIAECGFLSNAAEEKLLNTEEYQEKVASAICIGIINYLTEQP